MKVTVVNLDYETCTIDIEPSDDIDAVKRKLEAKTGIQPDLQRLIFQGQQLGGTQKMMAEYGICEGGKINIIHRGSLARSAQ